MKLSSITLAPVLAAMVLAGCADNTTKPASDPSMDPARTTSATPSTTTPSTTTPSTTPMGGTDTSSTPAPTTNTDPPMGAMNNDTMGNSAKPTMGTATTTTPATGTQGGAPQKMITTTPNPGSPAPAPNSQADNTRNNTRDRSPSAVTPMDQGNSPADIKITQQIRQSVVGDSSLGFNAKNVKIITKDAHVVLRGTVATAAERQSIEAKARAIAGVSDVENQIEVKK